MSGEGVIRERPVTVGSLRKWATGRLNQAGVKEAARSVDWMLAEVVGCTRAQLIGYPDRALQSEQARQFKRMTERRMEGEPVQYILGLAEFYGLEMLVSNAVLIPRPETELLVDTALDLVSEVPRPCLLDAGTGSGCIAVAIGHARRDAHITAVDISGSALDIARRNAVRHAVAVDFELADLSCNHLQIMPPSGFDLIVSNPPYVHPNEVANLEREVVDFEPNIALLSGDDPLRFYRLLLSHCTYMLRPRGSLVVEVHEERAELVSELLRTAGFVDIEIKSDLAGKERVVFGSRSDIRQALVDFPQA